VVIKHLRKVLGYWSIVIDKVVNPKCWWYFYLLLIVSETVFLYTRN